MLVTMGAHSSSARTRLRHSRPETNSLSVEERRVILRAWHLARGYNKEPYYIRRLLTEGSVKASDKRAVFVGADTAEAAGGVIARDLFQHDDGGWFENVALDRLARERLDAVGAEVRSEGWK